MYFVLALSDDTAIALSDDTATLGKVCVFARCSDSSALTEQANTAALYMSSPADMQRCSAASDASCAPAHADASSGRTRGRAQVGFEDLKAATDKRYYKFRSQQLLHLDDPNMCAARAAVDLVPHATGVLGANIASSAITQECGTTCMLKVFY